MRFNEKELQTLALQFKSEIEGNLRFWEKQEGLFRTNLGISYKMLCCDSLTYTFILSYLN